jgi:hypothetical protein
MLSLRLFFSARDEESPRGLGSYGSKNGGAFVAGSGTVFFLRLFPAFFRTR